MRSARRDEEVYQTEQIRVDVGLPSWTDDDGTEHPPRVQEGVPVLGESWRVRGKTSSAASELVDWMLEQGLEGEDAALPLLEVVELDGCPIKERALRGYAGGHSPPAPSRPPPSASAAGRRSAKKARRATRHCCSGSPPPKNSRPSWTLPPADHY